MRRPPFVVTFVTVVVGLLVAVGFLWRHVRAVSAAEALARHRDECPAQLRAALAEQRAAHRQHARYAADFDALGFSPPRGNHGVYVLLRGGPVTARKKEWPTPTAGATVIGVDEFIWPRHATARLLAQLPARLAGGVSEGVSGACPACEVVMACVTELDGEPGATTWSISSAERTAADGRRVAAGEPWVEPR